MNKQSMLYKTLCRALSLKRPHKSQTTADFTNWLATAVPEHLQERTFMDEVGNLHVDARENTSHRTLFVAHVDTVHKEQGANKIRKTKSKWYADGAPLGADDGAGCAILMELLHADVCAYYVFTQGEEVGGIGAKHLVTADAALLGDFDRAIAFDRRGIDSVITHQGWGRCCSDVFASALSDVLSADGVLMYLGDDTGVYTDTAEFVDIIPECTNISVGYMNEHSAREELDIVHFEALAHAVTSIKWDELPVSRDPHVPDPDDKWGKYAYSWKYETNWDMPKATSVSKKSKGKAKSKEDSYWAQFTDEDEYMDDEAMYLEDALYEAMVGAPDALLELIAESVYPEDPKMALQFLNKRLLTDELLQEALEMSHAYDPYTVLCTLFDSIHTNV